MPENYPDRIYHLTFMIEAGNDSSAKLFSPLRERNDAQAVQCLMFNV